MLFGNNDCAPKIHLWVNLDTSYDVYNREIGTVTKWRPIKTAPKDGTGVDLWVVEDNGASGRVPDAWYDPKIKKWVSITIQVKDSHFEAYPVEGTPTHWMPTPAPPKEIQNAMRGVTHYDGVD